VPYLGRVIVVDNSAFCNNDRAMLHSGRKGPPEPFSWIKISYDAGAIVLLLVVITGVLVTGWGWMRWVGGFLTVVALTFLIQKAGWRMLTDDLRAQIPHDSTELHKGTIHSYADLWRWLRQSRRTSEE
jgi:hypothetical protein